MQLDCTGIAGGFILADAALAPVSEWFEPDYWRERGVGETVGRGRGEVVSAGENSEWVLRHYRRGGWPGRFIADRYLWRGHEASRPLRELRLLAALVECGAPVVRPVAARVLRRGLGYSGDILTGRVADARTLADCAGHLDGDAWARIGRAIRHFHAAGGWHADLNAHNVLLAPAGVFIVDLDRGRLVAPGARAQRRNLDRLRRSLVKLGLLPDVEAGWQSLRNGYARIDQ